MRCTRLIGRHAGSACGRLRLGFVSSISARVTQFPIQEQLGNAGALASTHKSIGGYRAAFPKICSLVSKFKGTFETDIMQIGMTDASTELIVTLTSSWGQSGKDVFWSVYRSAIVTVGPNLRVFFNALSLSQRGLNSLTKSHPSFLVCWTLSRHPHQIHAQRKHHPP